MGLFGPPDVEKMKAKQDVPGLIKALGYRKDDTIRQAAAKALGEIGDTRALQMIGNLRAVEPLLAVLGDREGKLRWAAAEALGRLGDPRAVEPLIAVLQDKGDDQRWAAARALGRIGDLRAVMPLIDALSDSNDSTRRDAADALDALGWKPDTGTAGVAYWIARKDWNRCATMGSAAKEPLAAELVRQVRMWQWGMYMKTTFDALVAALKQLGWKPDRGEAGAAYWIAQEKWDRCIQIGTPAVALLICALEDSHDGVRANAARALGQIGDASAVERLIYVLGDKQRKVGQAALALGEIGDVRALEPLIAALKDKDMVSDAAKAIGQIGDARAVVPLVLLCVNTADKTKKAAFAAVIAIGAPAVEPLIAALSHKDAQVRDIAAQALGRIKDPRAVDSLIAALADKDEMVPQMAAKALGWIGDPRAVEPLMEALKSDNLLARQPAAEALGLMHDPRAVYALIAALKEGLPSGAPPRNIEESDWSVFISRHEYMMRQEVAGALIAIGAASVDPLIAVLQVEDRSVRGFAAAALGEIGEKRAIEPLTALLEDKDSKVREAAASALKQLDWQPPDSVPSGETNIDSKELKSRYLQGERNFNNADLRQADLSWTDLSEINLENADLREANLKGATLTGANLRKADLQGANLYGATLRGADLSEANLYGADLTGAFMMATNLVGATLPDGTEILS